MSRNYVIAVVPFPKNPLYHWTIFMHLGNTIMGGGWKSYRMALGPGPVCHVPRSPFVTPCPVYPTPGPHTTLLTFSPAQGSILISQSETSLVTPEPIRGQ